MLSKSYLSFIVCLILLCFIVVSPQAFDDIDEDHETPAIHNKGPLPKDKVLLKDTKTLTFHRNRKTTSKRTHSIHQLSCVGGTAGCKLFTPNVVECENIGFNQDKRSYNWKCHADISERVKFNHVEVICEGYDYPEDDYILVGSCGLEFTLDYTDPHDYHDNSYFKHMDDHEKELHQERVKATAKPAAVSYTNRIAIYLEQQVNNMFSHIYLIGGFFALVLCSILIVRIFTATNEANRNAGKKSSSLRGSSYGPLSSAVLTAKKAC